VGSAPVEEALELDILEPPEGMVIGHVYSRTNDVAIYELRPEVKSRHH
jgi:hypothetical protein